MIVLDASAAVELLLDSPAGRRVATVIADPEMGIHAPHLVDVEAVSALRRLASDRAIDDEEAAQAIEDLLALDLGRASVPLLAEPYPAFGKPFALRNS